MGNKWNYLPFTEAVEVNPSVPLKRGKIYPFVDMKAIESSRRGASESEFREFKSGGARFMPFDTLMARITPCLENGKIARYIPSEGAGGPAFGSTEFIIIRGREGITDNDYAYYLTKWEEFRQFAISQMTGSSGRQRVPADSLAKFLAPVPESLSEQRAIAHILGTLDDKIELNRQMNRTLEAMAQALFKSWFIDFDPVVVNALCTGNPVPEKFAQRAAHYRDNPDALCLPEDTLSQFPDRFQDSELGPIPEGWKVNKIGDLLELAYGKALPKKSRKPGPYPVYGSGGIGGYHSEYFVEGPGIIVGRKGTVGSVYWEDEDFFPIDTVFYVKTKKPVPLYWIYLMLSRMDIKGMGADSAVPGVNRNAVYAHGWILPPAPALDLFRGFIQTTTNKLQENRKESDTLVSLRDTLLPKLISGELRVPDAEKLVEDVA